MTGMPQYPNGTLPLSHSQVSQTTTGTAVTASQTTMRFRFRRDGVPVNSRASLQRQKRDEDADETPGPVFPYLKFPGGGRARRFLLW